MKSDRRTRAYLLFPCSAWFIFVMSVQAWGMCAKKIASRGGQPQSGTLVISLATATRPSAPWKDLKGKLVQAGVLQEQQTLEIPLGLLRINTPELAYVEHTTLASLQNAVNRVAKTIPGQVYLQLLAQWSREAGAQIGSPFGDALIFLSFVNRPALRKASAEFALNPNLIPYEHVSRNFIGVMPTLADLEIATAGKNRSDAEAAVFSILAATLPTMHYFLMPNCSLWDGFTERMDGLLQLFEGTRKPFKDVFRIDFQVPQMFRTAGTVHLKQLSGRGLPILFYPFGGDFFGQSLLAELRLSLGGSPEQEVGGILGMDDDRADRLLNSIRAFQSITRDHASQTGVLEFMESVSAVSLPPSRPSQNN